MIIFNNWIRMKIMNNYRNPSNSPRLVKRNLNKVETLHQPSLINIHRPRLRCMIDSHQYGNRSNLWIRKLWIIMHRPTLLILKNIPSYHLGLQSFMMVKKMFHLMVHLLWVMVWSLPSMPQSRPTKILLTFLIHREEINWYFLEIDACIQYIRFLYE